MDDSISQEERRIREERERKKAEVRARLEAASRSKEKSFMTPERKKRLRTLLRHKAAEELKRQQEVKAEERRRVISERIGTKKNFDSMSEQELKSVCRQMHERLTNLESQKFDMELEASNKELEIHKMSTQVSDMKGKFVKPPLKRVPRFQVLIERMLLNARKEVGFTVTLNSVKKDQFKKEEAQETVRKDQEPEWSWKKDKFAGDQQQQHQEMAPPTED